MGRWGTALAIVAALAICGSATGTSLAAEPLPVTSVSPANGAELPLPSGPVPFEVVTPLPKLTMNIKVATQNVLGQRGSLAEDFQKDFIKATESDAYPTIYRGESRYVAGGNWWSSTPGTYYWQVEAYGVAPLREYVSPVYTLIIRSPAASPPTSSIPTLSLAESYAGVKEIVQFRTGHDEHHLNDKCHHTSQHTSTCTATWFSAGRISSNTFLYAGTFRLDREQDADHFSFAGFRERYACARRFGPKHCASAVHWHS